MSLTVAGDASNKPTGPSVNSNGEHTSTDSNNHTNKTCTDIALHNPHVNNSDKDTITKATRHTHFESQSNVGNQTQLDFQTVVTTISEVGDIQGNTKNLPNDQIHSLPATSNESEERTDIPILETPGSSKENTAAELDTIVVPGPQLKLDSDQEIIHIIQIEQLESNGTPQLTQTPSIGCQTGVNDRTGITTDAEDIAKEILSCLSSFQPSNIERVSLPIEGDGDVDGEGGTGKLLVDCAIQANDYEIERRSGRVPARKRVVPFKFR